MWSKTRASPGAGEQGSTLITWEFHSKTSFFPYIPIHNTKGEDAVFSGL